MISKPNIIYLLADDSRRHSLPQGQWAQAYFVRVVHRSPITRISRIVDSMTPGKASGTSTIMDEKSPSIGGD